MIIARKSALLMDMPEGKLPGFYAQIIKALASKAPLFDRDKELLIFNSPSERELAYPVMEQYKVPYENMELLLLPAASDYKSDFTDYGFISRSDNGYLYADSVYLFTLHSSGPNAEPVQALEQLEEHLLVSSPHSAAEAYYATDAQHDELVHRIAKAYNCEARPLL
jgi:hypothetical protein